MIYSYQKGSVQLRDGEWTLRYREYDPAKRKWSSKRKKLGCYRTRKEALRAAEPIMAEINDRNNSPQPVASLPRLREVTFEEFIEGRWKAYTVPARYQPSTRDHHKSLVKNHLLPFFGQMRMRDIAPVDISEFLESKLEMSGYTQQNLYGMLHLMFDIAAQYDLIEHSPIRPKLHKPLMEPSEKPTLTAAQIRAVLDELPDEQERLFVLLLAVTGMRMGEAMALRWMDFDQKRLEISIKHTLYRMKLKQAKTKSSQRPLRLAPSVAGLPVAHKERSGFQTLTDFIFCRAEGQPLDYSVLCKNLYKAMDRAGIKRVKDRYGFHIFRHTAGSLLYARSRDLKLVQSTLGHADISTTSDIYVHMDDKIIGEGAEILAEEILGNCALTVPGKSEKAA